MGAGTHCPGLLRTGLGQLKRRRSWRCRSWRRRSSDAAEFCLLDANIANATTGDFDENDSTHLSACRELGRGLNDKLRTKLCCLFAGRGRSRRGCKRRAELYWAKGSVHAFQPRLPGQPNHAAKRDRASYRAGTRRAGTGSGAINRRQPQCNSTAQSCTRPNRRAADVHRLAGAAGERFRDG
jgi:hypothetical protein